LSATSGISLTEVGVLPWNLSNCNYTTFSTSTQSAQKE